MAGTATDENQRQLAFEEREFAADPRDWCALRLLIEEIDEDMRERRKHLLLRTAQWLMAHDVFRKIEARKMVRAQPHPRDLEYHNTLASSLVGAGKMLLMQLQEHHDIDPLHIGIRFEDIRTMVIAVERDYNQWHSGMTDERRKSILKDVFGG
ncbi:MAG: hypothetical protein AAGI48_17750 [Verrucomicrobiota bacterium]